MAKLLLVFVIALFALQGTTPAAINHLESRNAFGDTVQELTEDLETIIVNLNVRLAELTKDFTEKFDKILQEANFNEIITNLRKEVAKINSEDIAIDFCGETAINEIEQLEEYVRKHTFTCKYEVDANVDGLKNKLELLVQRVQELNSEIIRDVHICMKQSHGNMNKFGECLKEKVETIKTEMEEVNKVVLETLDEVEKSSDFVMNKFSECVLDARQEVESKAQLVVKNMKTCVQGAENTRVLSVSDVLVDLSEKLQHLLTELLQRIAKVSINFNEKITEIIKELSFERVMNELRQIVSDLIDDDSSPDECERVAKEEVQALDNLINKHVFTCKFENVQEIESLVSKMQVLVERSRVLLRELLRDVYVCKKESHGDSNKYEKCLKQKVDLIKSEIDEVEKASQEAMDEVENISNVLVDKFETCARTYETEVENKALQIVTDLKTCMQFTHLFPKTSQQESAESIQNYYKILANKIQEEEMTVTVNLPEEITTFSDKVNIIVSNHNIEVLIVKIKEQVEELLSQSNKDTTECKLEVTSKVDLLVSDSQSALEQCVSDVQLVADDLEKQFKILAEKSAVLADELSNNILVCAQEYPTNVIGFSKCLIERAESLKDKVVELQEEVDKTMTLALETTKEAVQSLNKCMDKVEDETSTKGQLVIEDLQKCIRNLDIKSQQESAESIQNYYKILANKIQEEEMTVTVNLPKEITTFSDKINIIVSNHNIEVLIVKIKEQVEELLSQSNKDTTECKLEVTSKVDLLVSDSQSALEQCVSDVQLVADDLEKQFNVLAEKSTVLADELSNNILVCAQEYPINVIGFSKCLIERAESLKDKVVELQEEVDKTMTLALETTKEAVQSLNKCMDKVEEETTTKGQLVIEDLQKCIRNLDLLF